MRGRERVRFLDISFRRSCLACVRALRPCANYRPSQRLPACPTPSPLPQALLPTSSARDPFLPSLSSCAPCRSFPFTCDGLQHGSHCYGALTISRTGEVKRAGRSIASGGGLADGWQRQVRRCMAVKASVALPVGSRSSRRLITSRPAAGLCGDSESPAACSARFSSRGLLLGFALAALHCTDPRTKAAQYRRR